MPARECFLSPALPFSVPFGYADQKRRHSTQSPFSVMQSEWLSRAIGL